MAGVLPAVCGTGISSACRGFSVTSGTVPVGNRLLGTCRIDDREAADAYTDVAAMKDGAFVGPAVTDPVDHVAKNMFVGLT